MIFTKMHGCGNDYIYFDCFNESLNNPEKLAPALCDRHFGIGGDGIILILPAMDPDNADIRMQMNNVDGSIAEMCGNGLRCFAKYVYDHNVVPRKNPLRVETGAGILETELFPGGDGKIEQVRINMGRPVTNGADIPVNISSNPVLNFPLQISGRKFQINCISMGNPHAVIYVEDARGIDLAAYGPLIETHDLFPNRTNVEFVQVVGQNEVIQTTWERGCGETLACGTGAAAVCAAGVLSKRTDEKLLVHLKGGDLELDWTGRRDMLLKGPAVEVFQGEISLQT